MQVDLVGFSRAPTTVDVTGGDASGTVAVLGDSITDAAGTDVDKDTRWTDVLARRVHERPAGRRLTVVNAAIGGGTLNGFGNSLVADNGLLRLERDVLSQSGVSDVIVFEGTTDILLGSTSDQVIYAMTRPPSVSMTPASAPSSPTSFPESPVTIGRPKWRCSPIRSITGSPVRRYSTA
ncbi:GDSL-type esterase/lipase family protein [Actinopolymorpha sp. B11F2]|uniref:GDSL-type esterase/lipase family protein n=1 Tax=Actinopolymorpha sp. B11F2 TaxID=3160862 RepID=UPI0032E41DC6